MIDQNVRIVMLMEETILVTGATAIIAFSSVSLQTHTEKNSPSPIILHPGSNK